MYAKSELGFARCTDTATVVAARGPIGDRRMHAGPVVTGFGSTCVTVVCATGAADDTRAILADVSGTAIAVRNAARDACFSREIAVIAGRTRTCTRRGDMTIHHCAAILAIAVRSVRRAVARAAVNSTIAAQSPAARSQEQQRNTRDPSHSPYTAMTRCFVIPIGSDRMAREK